MTPPRLSTWLVKLAAPPDSRPFMLGDLASEYERLATTAGPRAARRWYRRQAYRSALPLLRIRVGAASRWVGQWREFALANSFLDAARWVRRRPWVSATVVGTIGVALAACLAAFAVADATVFRPLPYPGSGQLVRVWTTGPTRPAGVRSVSLADFTDWRDRSTTFVALTAYAPVTLRLTGRGEPREVSAVRVSKDFDRLVSLPIAVGRYLTETDYNAAERPAVLSHAFATREFGIPRLSIDQTLTLDDVVYRIVGVLPDREVSLPLDPHDLWIPLLPRQGAFWESSRGSGWLTVLGRLNPDSSPERAESDLTAVARSLAAEYPATNRDKVAGRVVRLVDELASPVAAGLSLVGIAVAAVLALACANVVNLLLAGAYVRQREFAVRTAIGASRGRLVAQVFAEHLLLASLAGLLALLLAPPLVRGFLLLAAASRDTVPPVEIDATLMSVTVVFVLIVAVSLTLPVAVRLKKTTLVPALHVRAGAPLPRGIGRHALVAVQVAVSVLLIAGGIALVRTANRLSAVDRGFDPAHILTFTATPSPNRYRTATATLNFYKSIVDACQHAPGVEAAASAVAVPFTSYGWQFGIRPAGASSDTLVAVNLTTDRYFDTLRIRLIDGRLLSTEEQRSDVPVVVVNEPLARLIAPNRSAVGLSFPYSGRSWTIVGVVAGTRQRQLRDAPTPELFLPWGQAGQRPQTFVVRTQGPPAAVLPSIVAAIHAIDPLTPVANVMTLDERLHDARRSESFRAALLLSLAGVAIALAAFGAYSVTSNAVAARTREYGIRLALGARPVSIQRQALGTTAWPAVAGVVIGVLTVAATGPWLSPFMFETNPRDGVTLTAVVLAVLAITMAAGLGSARRASRTDPLKALRAE